jgi:hypothetical protein
MSIAAAHEAMGVASLACKTDTADAYVLTELRRHDLVTVIWRLEPAVRVERERARFRLLLVRHQVMLKNRIHPSTSTQSRQPLLRGGLAPRRPAELP